MEKELLDILYEKNNKRTRRENVTGEPSLQVDLLIIRSRKIFILNVIETRSRYLWTAIQKTKTCGETGENLIKIIQLVKQLIPDIRYIYSDDGNEFKGDVPKLLESEGMILKKMNKKREGTPEGHPLTLIDRVVKSLTNKLLLELDTLEKTVEEIVEEFVSEYNNRSPSEDVLETLSEGDPEEFEPDEYVLRLIRSDERRRKLSKMKPEKMIWYPIPYQVIGPYKNNQYELRDMYTGKKYGLRPKWYQLKKITEEQMEQFLEHREKLMKVFKKENNITEEKKKPIKIKERGNTLPINNIDDFFQDIEGINLYDNVPQTPFRLVVAANSGAGKTNIVLNLLKDYLYYDYLILCYKNQTEPKYQFFRDFIDAVNRRILEEHEEYSREHNVHIKILASDPGKYGLKRPIQLYVYHELEHLPHLKYFEQDEQLKALQKIIVIDDFLNEKDQDVVKDYFIYSRKLNFSCIYISQTFHKTPQVIRSNASDIILMKHTRREVKTLAQTLGGHLSSEEFEELMNRATGKKFGFLYIRTAATADDMFRIGFSDPVKIEDDSDDEDRVDNDFESSEEI